MPDSSIDFPGFNVMRVSGGPWFVVFNPDQGLSVGDQITVSVDQRLVLPHAQSTSINAGGMIQLQVTSGNPASCQVVMQPSIWPTAGAPFDGRGYRSGLLSAFDGFLQGAEKLEPGTLQPGATEVLQALVAPRIPATFVESLYLSYGVFSQDNPGRGYFDAQPGMRLSLAFEERQYVPPAAGTGLLSGFIGGATVTTDVISVGGPSGTPRLGLDAFFSVVRLPPVGPAVGGAGGIIDLVGSTAGLRRLRVCYPASSFPGADEGGKVGAAYNVALLGAPDLATLATATTSYYNSGNAGPYLVGYFRGRTVIRAQIPLLVNGTQVQYVPVGTTLRQLLQQFRVLPRLPGIVASDASNHVKYKRFLPGLGVTELYDPEAYHQVVLTGGDGPDSAGADVLDFPVLAGDTLSLPVPGSDS